MNTVQFILVALFGCAMIKIAAAGCEWYCSSTSDGVECGIRCRFMQQEMRDVEDSPEMVKRSAEFENQLPCTFTTYDVDGDGLVTMTELDSLLHSVMEDHAIKATFYMMDRNDDGVIGKYEFRMGPLARRNCA